MRNHMEIAAPARLTPVGSRWKHLGRGTTYTVVGHCMIEETWRPGVRYSADADGLEIVRDGALFTDGRFEMMSAIQ